MDLCVLMYTTTKLLSHSLVLE